MLAYLDCFSGISGDMLLGALLDAGLDIEALRAGLATLPLDGYTLGAETVMDHGIHGTRALVQIEPSQQQGEQHPHRHLAEIEEMIVAAGLPERARERALAIFRRLSQAEAAIHNMSPGEVAFHEVGAVDSIVDIVGAALGLELLGIDALYCSELPLTSGRVQTAHGPLPVPAPATLALLQGTAAVWRSLPTEGELVTPTGAAIVAELARFERPTMRLHATGYGFGQKQLPWANCLRVLIGEEVETLDKSSIEQDDEHDEVVVLESNIDTMSGEALGWLMEQLLAAGALDVSYLPLHMKKNRPGTLLMVIARPEDAEGLARQVLRESGTLGIRMRRQERLKAERRVEEIETPLGSVHIKLKLIGGEVIAVTPEYEDCRALAAQHHMPLESMMERVREAARAHFGLSHP
jgi:uncharacterized protein (TIGR00299 family) protein